MAARLVARALKEGINFKLRDLFELRTIEKLAEAVDEASQDLQAPLQDPEPLLPSVTLERLREAQQDVNAWVYTEILRLSPTNTAQIAATFETLTSTHDALRVRIAPTNKRLWPSEVLPQGTTDLSAQILEADAEVTDAGLRAIAHSAVQVTAGSPAAIALRHDNQQTTIVLAVHCAAVDREGLHKLLSVFQDQLMSRPSHSLTEVLRTLDETGKAIGKDRIEIWKELLAPSQTSTLPDSKDSFAEIKVPLRSSKDIIIQALVDVAMRRQLKLFVDIDVPLPTSEASVFGPFTATAPLFVDKQKSSELDAEWSLLRYHNRSGRRELRKTATPQLLITESYGELPDPQQREGIETLYPAVIRFMSKDGQLHVSLLGLPAQITNDLYEVLTAAN